MARPSAPLARIPPVGFVRPYEPALTDSPRVASYAIPYSSIRSRTTSARFLKSIQGERALTLLKRGKNDAADVEVICEGRTTVIAVLILV